MRIIRNNLFASFCKYTILLVFVSIQAHEWNVYIYMHADTAYSEALQVIKQLKQELVEDASMRVCVDIQAKSSHKILFEDGDCKAISVASEEDQVEVITKGIKWASGCAMAMTSFLI